jgi:MATE family multidrug resistance protein
MIKQPESNTLRNIYKLTTFALPLSASMFINMFTSFGAMLMVAKLGENELAAGALAVSTYMTITMVLLIFYAVGILISHSRGQQKPLTDIGAIVTNALWLAATLALPVSLLLWNADSVLLFFKQDPDLVRRTTRYFHFAAFVMPPTFVCMVIYQFYTGIGRPRYSMMISTISMPLTLLLSYGLILGKFGLPVMGLAGITCALLIMQILICISMLFILFVGKEAKKYGIFTGKFWPTFSLYQTIFKLGYPIGLQFGGELAAMTLATYFMGYFGATALAASQIVSQYSMLILMLILGLSQALSLLVSEAYGKKESDLIAQYVWSAIYILSAVIAVALVLFLLLPDYLIQFFGGNMALHNAELMHLAVIFFALAIMTLFMDGIRHIIASGLRGLQDSKAPMNIGVACLWAISLPMSYVFGFTFNGGPVGLRIGFMSGFIVAAVLLGRRIKQYIHTLSSPALVSST